MAAAPPLPVLQRWAPRTMVSGAWLWELQISCGLQAAVVTYEQDSEVRGAHLPKPAEGGAASFVLVQRWASPRHKFLQTSSQAPLGFGGVFFFFFGFTLFFLLLLLKITSVVNPPPPPSSGADGLVAI